MATYSVRAPDGYVIKIQGPEGASQEEIIAKAQELYQAQQQEQPTEQPTEQPEPQEEPDYAEMGAGEVASKAVESFLPSLGQEISGIWQAVTNPIDTAMTVWDLGAGLLQNILPESVVQALGEDKESRELASAVGGYVADRYGGLDNLKKTIATDSAGFAADLAGILSGGSTIAAKVATKSARLAKVAPALKAASEKAALIDPVTLGAKGVTKATTATVGKVAPAALAFTSGVGKKSIEKAYESGFEGGEALKNFRDNMKGADPQGILDDALNNLEEMRLSKNKMYEEGMNKLSASQVKIGYNKIDYALAQAKKQAGSLDTKTGRVLNRVEGLINNAKNQGYNSPIQMDELKRALNEIRMDQPYGSQRQAVVGQIQDTVRDLIVKADPEYAKTMETYGKAAEAMKELKQVLSVKKGGNPDTALRKLLSVMRDNVQTNYGKRATLAEELEAAGSASFMGKIAGQELSSALPRGLQGRLLGGIGLPGAGVSIGAGLLSPASLAYGALASPRLIGETAQLTGQARRKAQKAAQVLPSATFSYLGLFGRDIEEEE